MAVAKPIQIETEIRKATKVVAGKDRQEYLAKLVQKANELPEDEWDELSKEAKKWVNVATKAYNADAAIPEFETTAEQPARPKAGRRAPEPEDDEGDDEGEDAGDEGDEEADDEAADDEEAEDDGDEESDDEGDDEEDDEEEEDEPAPRRGAKAGKPAGRKGRRAEPEPEDDEDGDDEEDDDEEEDEPAPRTSKGGKAGKREPVRERTGRAASEKAGGKPAGRPAISSKASADKAPTARAEAGEPSTKDRIKLILIGDPNISNVELMKKLGKHAKTMSSVTIANTRSDFRHSLKILKREGKLKGVSVI